jgi:hypothetical protein
MTSTDPPAADGNIPTISIKYLLRLTAFSLAYSHQNTSVGFALNIRALGIVDRFCIPSFPPIYVTYYSSPRSQVPDTRPKSLFSHYPSQLLRSRGILGSQEVLSSFIPLVIGYW